MKNILSFDVERSCDSHYAHKRDIGEDDRSGIEDGVDMILSRLRPKRIKATFFVLGMIAEKFPEIVKRLDLEGHEVATHGFSHELISLMTPKRFKEELRRSIDIISSITGKAVFGHRAPGYSITKDSMWATDIISECGLKYDSSIYPVSMRLFTNGGVVGAPAKPYMLTDGLAEFPPASVSIFGIRLPVATTFYFRLYPYPFTKRSIDALNLDDSVATLNFHSWEFSYSRQKMRLPFVQHIKHYHNLSKVGSRFGRLINDFDFVTCKDMFDALFV